MGLQFAQLKQWKGDMPHFNEMELPLSIGSEICGSDKEFDQNLLNSYDGLLLAYSLNFL